MRWPSLLALIGACNGNQASLDPGTAKLVLELPHGSLDPKGYTSVEVVLHETGRDITQSAKLEPVSDQNPDPSSPKRSFHLSGIDPSDSVSIEATLRNDSGAAVGYGRTPVAEVLAGGQEIVVAVRRPIAYFAGTVSRDADGAPSPPPRHWTEVPATFSDLSVGANLDGRTQVGSNAVMMIGAGPNLYMITQMTSDPTGALTGPARVVPISTADHQAGTALTGPITGAVTDGAGADDGHTLVIGTTSHLFLVNATSDTTVALADGNFSRVAILTTDTGELDAVAIKNRGSTAGTCARSAELWWVPLTGGTGTAHRVATGGFSDIATDRGHAYYVDACKGELGELTATSLQMPRRIPGTGAGRPTALAVSNGQAYIGIETPPVTVNTPAVTSLLVASIGNAADSTDLEPRTLWTEGAQQALGVVAFPDVRRQLDASSVVFHHLEIGAGGDYVALTTSAHFHGAALPRVGIPAMTIDTEELRVFDAATGGIVQRYRSWCDGFVVMDIGDISGWQCAAAAGQSAPASDGYAHHIHSMTFQFGKK